MSRFEVLLRRQPERYDHHGRALYPLPSDTSDLRTQTDELIAGRVRAYVKFVAQRQIRALAMEVATLLGSRPAVILEVGGGSGHFFDAIRESVEIYINVDPNSDNPADDEMQRLRDPRYRHLICSAIDMPLADGSVDMTIALASLDHIPDHRRALAEMARITRPGGLALVLLNNRRSWWKVLLSGSGILRRREEAIAREHYIQLSLKELTAEVARFFQPIRSYTMTFLPYAPVIWRIFLPMFDVIGRLVLPHRGANSVVIGRR